MQKRKFASPVRNVLILSGRVDYILMKVYYWKWWCYISWIGEWRLVQSDALWYKWIKFFYKEKWKQDYFMLRCLKLKHELEAVMKSQQGGVQTKDYLIKGPSGWQCVHFVHHSFTTGGKLKECTPTNGEGAPFVGMLYFHFWRHPGHQAKDRLKTGFFLLLPSAPIPIWN
jgi:hypothetical protein